jgi:hypothetical protein
MNLSKRLTVPVMSGRRERPATLLFFGIIPSCVSVCALCCSGTLRYREESVHPPRGAPPGPPRGRTQRTSRPTHNATFFDNQVATLEFEARPDAITFEKAVLNASKNPPWRNPTNTARPTEPQALIATV